MVTVQYSPDKMQIKCGYDRYTEDLIGDLSYEANVKIRRYMHTNLSLIHI